MLGREPGSNRNVDCGTVAQLPDGLNGPLAVGWLTDQHGSLIVLQGAGEDLRGARRATIDQDRYRQIDNAAAGSGVVGLFRSVAVLFVHNYIAVLQELSRYIQDRVRK